MPVLPFHRYIGPGNKSDNGEPVDEDDRIARQHDIKYDNAKTEEDIRNADIQAIILFRKNWLDGNWHSLIGDVGLTVKYFIESFTGVIYPDVQEIIRHQKCEIIVIGNIIQLHCVNKKRPLIEKFNSETFSGGKKNNKYPMALCYLNIFHDKQKVLLPYFVYIPLNWTEVYFQMQPKNTDKDTYHGMLDFITSDTLKLSNIYNIKNNSKQHKLWQYFNKFCVLSNQFNETTIRKKNKENNFIRSIYSGYVFVDQDWNLILEKM